MRTTMREYLESLGYTILKETEGIIIYQKPNGFKGWRLNATPAEIIEREVA